MIKIRRYHPNFVTVDDDFVYDYSFNTKEDFLAEGWVRSWLEDGFILKEEAYKEPVGVSTNNPYSHMLLAVSPDELKWYVVAYLYKGSDDLSLPTWRYVK